MSFKIVRVTSEAKFLRTTSLYGWRVACKLS